MPARRKPDPTGPPAPRKLLDQVKDRAFRRALARGERATNLHVETDVLPRGRTIATPDQRIALRRDTILVFADDAPELNWGHPCRYLLHDARSGELYREVPGAFPPYLVDPPRTFRLFHEQVKLATTLQRWRVRPDAYRVFRIPRSNRFAILYSGASNNRHTNDLEFLWRTLVDVYLVDEDKIYVLNYDGTLDYSGNPQPSNTWPGDSTTYRMPVNGAGTKAEFDAVVDELKGRIQGDDLLLVHTNNHGWYDGNGSYMSTHSGPSHYASDFAAKLGELPQYRCLMVMCEQCASGGFIDPIIAESTAQTTSVATACGPTVSSIGGADFDPFARDWIAAMNGYSPSGGTLSPDPDDNDDGKTTAREAFDYADAVHDPFDTPMFKQATGGGGGCTLSERSGRPWWWDLLEVAVDPYFGKPGPDPPPDFVRRVKERFVPLLEESGLEEAMDARMAGLRGEIKTQLDELARQAFAQARRTGRRSR
jgi:hypothetical protein